MQVHQQVYVDVESSDAALLDAVESDLPAEDDADITDEYDGPQRLQTENTERLVARVTFAATPSGDTAASNLYNTLVGHDLENLLSGSFIRRSRTPLGGVISSAARQWYKNHPAEQPTDVEGNDYVPSTWDPSNNILDKTTI